MRITETEHETRRDRMLHVAYELFCKHGIDSISIAQIAKTAGVSPNSIFRYFDNKVQLVHSAQTLLWDEIVACAVINSAEQSSTAQNGMQQLEILLSGFVNLYKEHSQYILFAYDSKVFFIRNHITLTEEWYNAMLEPIRQVFVTALEKGQLDGSVNKASEPNTQFLALWCIMRSYTDAAVLHDKVYTGENPWTTQFDRVLHYIQSILKPNK